MLLALEKKIRHRKNSKCLRGGWGGMLFAILKWVLKESLTESVTFERPEGSKQNM